jgi:probable F420-dependent oxidoreductase
MARPADLDSARHGLAARRPAAGLRLAVSLPAPFVSVRDCVELGRRAEREWGYPAIWLAETNGPDSFSLAGALAMATERVTLGTAIVPVYNRSPAVLAMSAGTLAELSGDRFVLGLGSSSHAIVEGWNGIPFERPLAHVRECVELVRQALVEPRTDYRGSVFRSRGLRLGARTAKPVPLYVAALREKMLRLAGAVGDGLIVNLFPLAALPRILAAWRAGAAEAGREIAGQEVVCRFQVCVTDDVPRARALVRAAFGGYVATPVYNRFFAWCGFEDVARDVAEAFDRGDRAGVAAAMTDAFVDGIAILGSAEACREQVAAFVAAGVTTPVIAPLAVDRESVLRVFEAFAPARHG